MATGNTLSALSSQNPSIQSMILSVIPEGIQRLADCAADAPHRYFTVAELELIVKGEDTKDLESSLADGIYMQGILPAIEWWIQVADCLLCGTGIKSKFADEEFEEQRTKLLSLLNDVLSSYSAALAEGTWYSLHNADRVPAGVELLKRYRLYTRYVCAFAREIWPNLNLEWLLKQA
jgi:hypothetical protein